MNKSLNLNRLIFLLMLKQEKYTRMFLAKKRDNLKIALQWYTLISNYDIIEISNRSLFAILIFNIIEKLLGCDKELGHARWKDGDTIVSVFFREFWIIDLRLLECCSLAKQFQFIDLINILAQYYCLPSYESKFQQHI